MASERSQEGPVVLQLQRWDTSQSRFDLSEFREAFISPTRELLLLLSFRRDALLLPLTRGESIDFDNEGFKHENMPRMDSPSSPTSAMPSTSMSCGNTASSEGISFETDAKLGHESTGVQTNNGRFISDVNSLAWGKCADTNKKHHETAFRELLFVAGNHGVTVHAFRQLHENTEALNSPLEAEEGHGQWLEWPPSTGSSDYMETSGGKATSWSTNGDKEGPYCSGDAMSAHFASNHSSKKWLRSFLTSVETKERDGVMWTSFPDKSTFPCLAKVVSFHILNDDSALLDYLIHGSPVSYKGVGKENVLDDLKTDFNVGIGNAYQCFKIFSSNSYNLIGFAFMQVNAAINSSDRSRDKSRNTVVLVSRLDICGMQWICSVKLKQEDKNKAAEWIDFQFSDNLLVCLAASGLVLFYGAMTGEYVARVDILEISGLKPRQYMEVQEKNLGETDTVRYTNASKDEKHECDKFISGFDGKCFRRLLVAPYTSLLAAVDETGCQKVALTNSACPRSHDPDVMWKCFSNFRVSDGRVCQSDLCSSGFSELQQKKSHRFPQSRRSLHCRKLFLPTTSTAADNMICFSSFGLTRLSRRLSLEGTKCSHIAHANLHLETNMYDDGFLNYGVNFDLKTEQETIVGESVGCVFHGCFYLVTANGLSVVLPSVSISSHFHPIESIGYPSPKICQHVSHEVGELMKTKDMEPILSPWEVEILDRVLLFEGSDEADLLCQENGWDLKVSRLRRLQLALAYLKLDEIEQSLENLAAINMAEEGILRLTLAAIYMMFDRAGSDNEISAASRLLALATRFATKKIREYAVSEDNFNKFEVEDKGAESSYLLSLLPYKEHDTNAYARKLDDMSHLLVVIRNLQSQVASKLSRPVQGPADDDEAQEYLPNYQMSINSDASPFEKLNQQNHVFSMLESASSPEKLALIPADSFDGVNHQDIESKDVAFVGQDMVPRKQIFPIENPQEMIARWELDKLDLKNVVKDALLSGRLPLAVLKLHLHRTKDLTDEKDPNDLFTEVRDVGRSIAYDLFMKGETELAVATLQKLGEDVEACLRQLLFGTVNRLLRNRIIGEMKKYGYLRPYELAVLDRLSLIERIYPSSSFWRSYLFRRTEVKGDSTTIISPTKNSFQLLHPHSFRNITMECGEVDGVVLGSWTDMNENSSNYVDEDSNIVGYWASAAVWFNAWDQKTIDRILLDQPFVMGVHVMWESQLEYHICHNDWEEVSKLLDMIPSSLTPIRSLQISLDGLQSSSSFRCGIEVPDFLSYVYSPDELEDVYADIPNVKIFQSSAHSTCSAWLRMLLDKQLAKKLVFLKEYWDGTTEIISLLARSGFIGEKNKMLFQDELVLEPSDMNFINLGSEFQQNTLQTLHKLVIHHCSQHNLPYLLDLYLDHHELALDTDILGFMQDAAGDCQWAKWLLFSRIKGLEYDASLCNARTIVSRDVAPSSNLMPLEVNDVIHTVDDIAENGWVMAALATLMFAPLPMENCLSSGSVKRRSNSSAQCTLENLRSALQRFPTLWRMLVAAALGNATYDFRGPSFRTVGSSALSVYLNWRDNVFYSSDHDASLLQMLPRWFHKGLRRLVQLFVQGPLGWQALTNLPAGEAYLQREIYFLINAGQYSEISAMSWEAAIQNQIEQELYASSVEGSGLGLEHHLHRGRTLAAFSHLLGYRVQKLKTEGANGGQSVASVRGQMNNIHVDMQMLMAPLRQSEESILSTIMPIAITNYQNSMLVASCAFFLELCGLSATTLRVDVAALRRISEFYSSNMKIEDQNRLLPIESILHAVSEEGAIADSLARALADIYLQQENPSICRQEGSSSTIYSGNLSRALMLVLQHLEKASLPRLLDSMTCGSWLLSGHGDGGNLRSQQKASSQHWSLVKVFCQLHQMPLSTKYLAFLARDNDWVGFLSEAQMGGYHFDTVLQVAKKDFKDSRLQTHVLTVLKGMQSKRMTVSSQTPSGLQQMGANVSVGVGQGYDVPAELFGILAECEKQRQPGKALLVKAKQLSWSMLAIIASCFPDVTPLSCLTVWLEITAARDASLVKENDIATQIAKNVGAAVEALNSLPANEQLPTLSYNRKNPKRQRLFDPLSPPSGFAGNYSSDARASAEGTKERVAGEEVKETSNSHEWSVSLPKMLSVLCEQQQFLPMLRAFEMFLPSCSLLSFIRALQAFSQMRLSEASAHLGSFSARVKEEPTVLNLSTSWISSTASKAANAILSNCPSPYEKRCLLQLLAETDFGDGGSAATYYRQQYWKINLAEPALRKNDDILLGNNTLDDASLLTALEKNGHWEQARTWAQQLEASGQQWKSAAHHVTETQAESMVAEWREFLWDVPEERVALWGHCQTLFTRNSFPALQAGLFFLKHAEAVERDLPPRELHALLLLSLQWLSGMITHSNPVYEVHLLREIETRVWLLAVESEAQVKSERDLNLNSSSQEQVYSKSCNIIDKTANIISKMDSHLNAMKNRTSDKVDGKESNFTQLKGTQAYLKGSQAWDTGISNAVSSVKSKRRAKPHGYPRRFTEDTIDRSTDLEDGSTLAAFKSDLEDENASAESSLSRWEDRIGPAELERAILSLLEFGQISAAKQLQHKLSRRNAPLEFKFVDAALKLAELSTPPQITSLSLLDKDLCSVIQSYDNMSEDQLIDTLQVLENLSFMVMEGSGRGLCKRIVAVVKCANVLDISFSEAFEKQPAELLQLLSLKAQDSFEEAKLLIETHSMPATSIARILAESFLKGLLAAHRGGYIDSQKEEGPAPLLWRFSDFLRWAELCPSEPEVGHALMRLVITGQEIPHACEVELLILSHHFYKSSACLDGVDVLVALAATRVEAYVSEGDFSCLARLLTGVGNFHALNFILGILIENGQLDLLLQKYSAIAEAKTSAEEAGFRMAVLTSLKHFNPNDHDAFAMVYNHFDMKDEAALLLESRARQCSQGWQLYRDKYQHEDLLEAMRYYIEAAEVYSSIDAGNKTHNSCAQASLVSLQIRMPDLQWLNLSARNARSTLVNQSRFQEALIIAESYKLNQPSEWVPVLWNLMSKPELLEQFVAEFVAVLPLQPSMLVELAKIYRSEVVARGEQSHFTVWLTGGSGLPVDGPRYLSRSFRCLLMRTRDLRLRVQLASVETGFNDVIKACNKELDKVPENAGPLVLRKGHGGAYLPLH